MTAKFKVDEKLVACLYQQGQNAYDISRKLGCSVVPIYRSLRKSDVTTRTKQEASSLSYSRRIKFDDTQLVTLYQKGLSLFAIKKDLNCSRGAIRRRLSELGIPIRTKFEQLEKYPKYSEVTIDILIDLYSNQKYSVSEVGELLGVPTHIIVARIKKFNIPRHRAKWLHKGAPNKGQKASPNTRAILRASWARNKEERVAKMLSTWLISLQIKPNNLEKRIIELIDKYKLPFIYTGDGSFIIGRVNPDFVETNGHKLALEVFGNYWHTKFVNLDKESAEKQRREILEKYGWKLIILWEEDILKDNWEEYCLEQIRRCENDSQKTCSLSIT